MDGNSHHCGYSFSTAIIRQLNLARTDSSTSLLRDDRSSTAKSSIAASDPVRDSATLGFSLISDTIVSDTVDADVVEA